MNQLVTKQIVLDFFAGKVTALQQQQIDEWSRDPDHQELFYKWLEEWELAHLQYMADQPAAMESYHAFLFREQSSQPTAADEPAKPVGVYSWRNWLSWSMAASILLLLGVFFFHQQLLTNTYTTTFGQTRKLTLADGSQVTLNANSSLQVPRFGFGSQSREVQLTGEALFSVTHTATNQRFVVKTNNGADVVVLGTEFTLLARPRGTEVVLSRGKVEVNYQQADRLARQVTLKPGDWLTLSKTGKAQLKSNTQLSNFAAWRDHRYVFNHTSLQELTNLFLDNFGITLEISDPETAALTLSGAYPAQSGDELLQIIAEALNIQITRQNGTVLLSPRAL